jgi:hypothetical protein
LLAVFLNVPFVRKRVDRKYARSGKYLSLPHDPTENEISVFEIRTGFFDAKYRLKGDTYSLADLRATGGWTSQTLDIKDHGLLTYIYSGYKIDPSAGTPEFDGHGYAYIQLSGQHYQEGTGYWIDDDPNAELKRKNSTYVKLTGANRRRITQNQALWKRFLWLFVLPDRSIVSAFKELPSAEKNRHPFARPVK